MAENPIPINPVPTPIIPAAIRCNPIPLNPSFGTPCIRAIMDRTAPAIEIPTPVII